MPPVIMKVGELIPLESSKFQAGASYQWHVETGRAKTAPCHFRILSKEESRDIREEMNADTSESEIYQALWLQVKSDMRPELSLHTDSLRIMRMKMKNYKFT